MLTAAGEVLLTHCLHMLSRLDTYLIARRDLETGPFGTLLRRAWYSPLGR
jgi:DNA-binding transcriptional LysR family regulator